MLPFRPSLASSSVAEFHSIDSFALSSWRSARLFGIDEPRPDDAESDQPLLQRVVVRQRVERPAGRRRGHGLPRLPALHRGHLAGKQGFDFGFPEPEWDGKQHRRRREWERGRQGEEAAEGEGRVIPCICSPRDVYDSGLGWTRLGLEYLKYTDTGTAGQAHFHVRPA